MVRNEGSHTYPQSPRVKGKNSKTAKVCEEMMMINNPILAKDINTQIQAAGSISRSVVSNCSSPRGL